MHLASTIHPQSYHMSWCMEINETQPLFLREDNRDYNHVTEEMTVSRIGSLGYKSEEREMPLTGQKRSSMCLVANVSGIHFISEPYSQFLSSLYCIRKESRLREFQGVSMRLWFYIESYHRTRPDGLETCQMKPLDKTMKFFSLNGYLSILHTKNYKNFGTSAPSPLIPTLC